jgi:hypothetical protein
MKIKWEANKTLNVVNYFTEISLFCRIPQAHSCSWSLLVFKNSIMVETGPLHLQQFTNSHFHIPLMCNWLPSQCSYSSPNKWSVARSDPSAQPQTVNVWQMVVVPVSLGTFLLLIWTAKTTVGRLLIPQYSEVEISVYDWLHIQGPHFSHDRVLQLCKSWRNSSMLLVVTLKNCSSFK